MGALPGAGDGPSEGLITQMLGNMVEHMESKPGSGEPSTTSSIGGLLCSGGKESTAARTDREGGAQDIIPGGLGEEVSEAGGNPSRHVSMVLQVVPLLAAFDFLGFAQEGLTEGGHLLLACLVKGKASGFQAPFPCGAQVSSLRVMDGDSTCNVGIQVKLIVASALGIPIRIDWVSVKDDLVSYHGVKGGGQEDRREGLAVAWGAAAGCEVCGLG